MLYQPYQSKRRRILAREGRWALHAACLAVLSCSAPVESDGPGLARIDLSVEAFELGVGQTRTIVARMYDAGGSEITAGRIFWSSERPEVATVNQQGLVTAVSLGSTQIAASVGGVSSVAAVTVNERPVSRIRVTPAASEVVAGSTARLTAEAVDANDVVVEGRTFTWLTSNPAVATVDNSGVVTGVAPGTVTIHAVTAGTEGSAAVTVLPAPVASIDLQPANAQVDVGATTQLVATPRDAAGRPLSGRDLTWVSSDPQVATVSQAGLVAGVTAGSATISVSAPGAGPGGSTPVRTASVTVLLPAVVRVAVTPGSVSIPIGAFADFSVSLFGQNDAPLSATGRTITWTSGNPTVATVNAATGRATGISLGSATIVVTVETPGRSGSQNGSATLTVTNVPVASVVVSPGAATVHVGPAYARTFTATTLSGQGVPLTGRTIAWSSTDPAVAAIDPASGQVTGVAPGTARINATSEGVTGGADVTVDLVAVSTVVVTPGAPALSTPPPQTVQLQAQPRDSSGAAITGSALGARTASWASGDPSVASVGTAGLVTAVAPGTALITATVDGTVGSASVTVTGNTVVASVTVTAPADSIIGTGPLQLTATLRDAANTVVTGPAVSWSSSDAAVATVGPASGLVTGVTAGTATITATAEGVTGALDVRVLAPVATVTITAPGATITHPGTLQASATLSDANGGTLTGRPVSWTSLDPGVATVDGSGLITSAGAGAARIVAESEGQTDTLTVDVALAVPVVTSVNLSPGHRNIAPFASAGYTATVTDQTGAALPGHPCSVDSSNPLVATVTPSGAATTNANGQIAITVTGLVLGNATISATCSGVTGTATVTVR
ncbi:MAG TPA: Ig-like domain-containing protein [Gemmatimonadaceae bacterium]|nr:Ig-like domain-containing protein [Gemmatimonadaceae bacterium]